MESWDDMKAIIRKQFIPNFYYKELFQKLQSLHQGIKSLEDYQKEKEIAIIKLIWLKIGKLLWLGFIMGRI
jgi:hypothetical protein